MMCDFEKNVLKYNSMLHSLIKNKFIDGHEKEDLMQLCYMKLYQCMQDFDESKGVKFGTYLYNSVNNMLIDMIRRQTISKMPKLVFVSGDDLILLGAVDESNESSVDNLYKLDDIIKELLKLPRGYITYMIYVMGMSFQEVSKIENISKPRISVLNKRNLTKLNEIFVKGVNKTE